MVGLTGAEFMGAYKNAKSVEEMTSAEAREEIKQRATAEWNAAIKAEMQRQCDAGESVSRGRAVKAVATNNAPLHKRLLLAHNPGPSQRAKIEAMFS